MGTPTAAFPGLSPLLGRAESRNRLRLQANFPKRSRDQLHPRAAQLQAAANLADRPADVEQYQSLHHQGRHNHFLPQRDPLGDDVLSEIAF